MRLSGLPTLLAVLAAATPVAADGVLEAAASGSTVPAQVATAAGSLPQFAPAVQGPAFSHREPAFSAFMHPVDLDGDLRQEIIVPFANYPPGPDRAEEIRVLRADPSSLAYTDATAEYLSGTPLSFVHPRVVATGDFNKDGGTDVFIGGHGYDQDPFPGEPDGLLLSQAFGGHQSLTAPPGTRTFTHAVAAGDINGDRIDDIYVGTIYGGVRGPYFLLGRKNGTPAIATDRLGPQVARRVRRYTAAALVDLNGDRRKDLVLGGDETSRSVVYRNKGRRAFRKRTPDLTLPVGLFGIGNTIVLDILAADLDTNGRPDLVLSETSATYHGYGLQVLMDSGGRYVDGTTARLLDGSGFNAAGCWKLRVMAADFFGDGLTDFVVHGTYPTASGDPVIWVNDGSGILTPHGRAFYNPGEASVDNNMLVPADVNGDGRSDLVWLGSVGPTEEALRTFVNLGVPFPGIGEAPTIVRQPVSRTVTVGAPLTLSVSARGQRPLAFQWHHNGAAVAGETGPVLTRRRAAARHAGKYRVYVTNAAGETASVEVRVNIR